MMKHLKKQILMIACALALFLLAPAAVEAAEMVGGHAVAPLTAAMAVNTNANVRSGPGTEYQKLATLPAGQALTVCGVTDNGWYQVIYGTQIAYMSGSLLTQIPVDDVMLAALAQQAVLVKQSGGAAANAANGTAAGSAANGAANGAATGNAAAAAATAQTQAAATAQAVPGSGNIIFVGDSRTGQMGNAVGGTAANSGVAFVSCYGGGQSWLASDVCKREIENLITPGSVIIINYGVNDLSHFNEYITTINNYNRRWREKGAVVYFATVGPVGPNEYNKTNWSVEHFNSQLAGRLDGSIGRIDLYTYLVTTGCNIQADGMHYQPDTYAKMYTYLMQSIGR